MKKNYTSPLATEVYIETESMIAQSVVVDDDTEVFTNDPGTQLGSGHRGQWGNLWK